MRKDNHIDKFKTKQAFDEFMREALTLESNLSRSLHHKHCETLYLYVDEDKK